LKVERGNRDLSGRAGAGGTGGEIPDKVPERLGAGGEIRSRMSLNYQKIG